MAETSGGCERSDQSEKQTTPDKKTSWKVLYRLSPEGRDICILCCENVVGKYKNPADMKIRLWDEHSADDGQFKLENVTKLTNAGEILESYLQLKLDATDYRIICKNCFRTVKRANEEKRKRVCHFETGRRKNAKKQVKRGGVSKAAITRLNARSLTLSYGEILNKQFQMGHNFKDPVLEWIDTHLVKDSQMPHDKGLENIEVQELDSDTVNIVVTGVEKCDSLQTRSCPTSFRLVGDNCDIRTKKRITNRLSTGEDMHLYILVAMQNRIKGDAKSEFGRRKDQVLCPSKFVPSVDDNLKLRQDFRNIVGNILIKYIKELDWMRKYVPTHIAHEYSKFTKKKSSVVIWRLMFDKNSSSNIGTLYQAKIFLNAVNAPLDPMDDPDAAYDLLSSYTDALVIACFEIVKSQTRTESALSWEQEENCNNILDLIVDNFALPEFPKVPTGKKYNKCPHCHKIYKRIKSLRKHITEKHNDEVSSLTLPSSTEDGVLNYSKNALALGLFAKSFVSARKQGNGKQIICLYKFMLLYFKLEARHKYAFYSLYTIAQVYHLLPPSMAHELVWNRTNNSEGKADSNVENDRTVEHHVKSFKKDCKSFQGKVTPKSIARASCSYTAMDTLMAAHDEASKIHSPSGKHVKQNVIADVHELAKQFSKHKIFEQLDGRYHHAFAGFKSNILENIDIEEFAEWVIKKIESFEKLSIYKMLNALPGDD
eukprot:gene13248-biopygen10567